MELYFFYLGNNVPKSVEPIAIPATVAPSAASGPLESLDEQITAQGTKIRDLKSKKAGKDVIDVEVKALLSLKADFKKAAGKDWDPKGTFHGTCLFSEKMRHIELGNINVKIFNQFI